MNKLAKKIRQPLADKVLKRIQKEIRKEVIDLSAVRAGRKQAQDMQATVKSTIDLAELPPAFAAYAWVQQQLSIMIEQLLCLKTLHRFNEILDEAEDLYTPEGPPMSPLTPSYFNCWTMFDIGIGIGRETLGSIAVAVNQRFGAHEKFLKLARQMVESRNGVYQITAVNNGLISMKELWTGLEFTARNASGYNGKAGEVWYTRVLPPNEMEPGVHVVFNTPYKMYQTSVKGWEQYFERTLSSSKIENDEQAFHQHMKFGNEPFYWPEYIFYSYANHTGNFILTKGLPDIDESLPHKDEFKESKIW